MQAITVEYPENGRAPIIGHFSEWTILGVWSVASWLLILRNISLLGRKQKTEELFQKTMNEHPSLVDEIYKEYLEQLYVNPKPALLFASTLPHPPSESNGVKLKTLLQDQALTPQFELIEKGLMDQSLWNEIKEGLRILFQKEAAEVTAISVATIAGGTIALLHVSNYSLGIFWSAQQAVYDYQNGDIPSIGGHSLEWCAEILGLVSFAWYYAGEIANVGRTRIIQRIFQENKPSNSGLERRYHEVMQREIRAIQDGLFFSIPRELMHHE